MPNVLPFQHAAAFAAGTAWRIAPIHSHAGPMTADMLDMLTDADADEIEDAWDAVRRRWGHGTADFSLAIVADPEFETQHPRGEGGKWIEKPGARPVRTVRLPTMDHEFSEGLVGHITALPLSVDDPYYSIMALDPRTGDAGVAGHLMLHEVLIEAIAPGEDAVQRDRFAHLVLQSLGTARQNVSIVLPYRAETDAEERADLRNTLDHLQRKGVDLHQGDLWVTYHQSANKLRFGMSAPSGMYAVDPEFETKHPRDPEGQWTEKGGTAVLDEGDADEPPIPAGFEIDEYNKYLGTLPTTDLWSTVVDLNARSQSAVYHFGRSVDLIVDPETGRAAFSVYKDHGPMIKELEPDDYINRQDAYARVVLMPHQVSGPGYMTIVPPYPHQMESDAARAQEEYRAVRTVLRWLEQSGVPPLHTEIFWASDLNIARSTAATGRITDMFAVDPEFERKHPRAPEGTAQGGKFIEKPGGDDGRGAAGPGAEGAGDTVLPAGAGVAGRTEPTVRPPAGIGQPTAIGPGTDRYIAERERRGDFSPEFAAGLRAAIAGLPAEAQTWLEEGWSKEVGSFPSMQVVDMDSEDVPGWVKSQLRSARAATLNGYRILYKRGDVPDAESLLHELAHTAFGDMQRRAPEIVAEAVENGRQVGEVMLDAAFSKKLRTKDIPQDENLSRAWWGARHVRDMAASVRRYLRGGKTDVTGSLELNLMLPPYQLRDLAAHVGLRTEGASDQWHVIAVYTALTQRYKAEVSAVYRDEELVTYKAGTDPAYAARLFGRLRKRANVPEGLQAAFTVQWDDFAIDPEFERKHPRGIKGTKTGGKFVEKPETDRVHRGERGWIVNRATGELLSASATGRPLDEEFSENVDFPNLIKHVLAGGTALVHTHPNETSFSDADWVVFANGLELMQVVTKDGTVYTLERPADWDWTRGTPRRMRDLWAQFEAEVFDDPKFNAPGATIDDQVKAMVEEINQRMANATGIRYTTDIPLLPAVQKVFAIDPEFESKHPRGEGGRWTEKGGQFTPKGGGEPIRVTLRSLAPEHAAQLRTLVEASGVSPRSITAGVRTKDWHGIVDPKGNMRLSRMLDTPESLRQSLAESQQMWDAELKRAGADAQGAPTNYLVEPSFRGVVLHELGHVWSVRVGMPLALLREHETWFRRLSGGAYTDDSSGLYEATAEGYAAWRLGRATPPAVAAEFTKTRRHYALDSDFTLAFAVDPDFETKHPRGPEGKWVEKGAFKSGETLGAATGPDKKASTWTPESGGLLFHGTRTGFTRWRTGEAYLTDDYREAEGYAKGVLGTGGRGRMPMVRTIHARPGATVDANAEIAAAINEGIFDPSTLEDIVARAREAGARYVTYEHPSIVYPDREQRVVIALHPNDDLKFLGGWSVGARSKSHAADFTLAFAVDPDFEKKHPRGKGAQGGQFVEKPGGASPEAGEAGISASKEASTRVLDVVRRLLTDQKTIGLREQLTQVRGVEPTGAIGRWEEGVEPSLAVRWRDGERVRVELARLAKLYKQDALAFWTDNAGTDARLSVQFPASPSPKLLDQVHQALTRTAIPGSSYLAAGREIVVYAPEAEHAGVHQRLTNALRSLNVPPNISTRRGKFELIFDSDYDAVIAGGARTHAAAPERTGEAMFMSRARAQALAEQMSLTSPKVETTEKDDDAEAKT
jgi:hypothetical protein